MLAAFFGATVAGGFSLTSLLLIRRKEDTTRREQAALQHLQRQIEDAIQYELVNTIWQSTGVDASFIDHVRFPKDLEQYVETTLADLRSRHNDYLRRLSPRRKS